VLSSAALLALAAPGISSPRPDGAADEPVSDPSPVSVDIGSAVVVERDGAIFMAGLSRRGGRHQFGVARYRPNGTLDRRFGRGGRVLTSFRAAEAAMRRSPNSRTASSSWQA
jgi:hypothetical protein